MGRRPLRPTQSDWRAQAAGYAQRSLLSKEDGQSILEESSAQKFPAGRSGSACHSLTWRSRQIPTQLAWPLYGQASILGRRSNPWGHGSGWAVRNGQLLLPQEVLPMTQGCILALQSLLLFILFHAFIISQSCVWACSCIFSFACFLFLKHT